MGEGLIQAYFEHGPVQDIVSMEKEFRLTLPNGTPMVGFLDFIVDRGEGLEVVELKTAAPDRLAGLPHGASTIPRTWILKPPTPLDGLSSPPLADGNSMVLAENYEAKFEALVARLDALERENKILREENALLKKWRFGRSSERLESGQLSFFEKGAR